MRLRLTERAENIPPCRLRPYLQPRCGKRGATRDWVPDVLSVVLLAAVTAWCICAMGGL